MFKTRLKAPISFTLSLCLVFSQAIAPLYAASIDLDANSKASLDKAQNGITAPVAEVKSNGDPLISAGESIKDIAGYDGSMRDSQKVKSSLFTDWSFSKATTDIEKETDKTAVASDLNAQGVRICSAGDLLVKGSNINIAERRGDVEWHQRKSYYFWDGIPRRYNDIYKIKVTIDERVAYFLSLDNDQTNTINGDH